MTEKHCLKDINECAQCLESVVLAGHGQGHGQGHTGFNCAIIQFHPVLF